MMPPYYQPQQQFAAGYNQTNVWGTPAMSFSALPLPIWDRRPPSDSSSLQPAGTFNINPGSAANYPGIHTNLSSLFFFFYIFSACLQREKYGMFSQTT